MFVRLLGAAVLMATIGCSDDNTFRNTSMMADMGSDFDLDAKHHMDAGDIGWDLPDFWGQEPAKHRPESAQCEDTREELLGGSSEECMSHDDCTDGRNGRCYGWNHTEPFCSYDECTSDDDCTDNLACRCRDYPRGFHHCLGGNCRVDADCGPQGYCSPSLGGCGYYRGVVGYYCRTREDRCLDDTDCGGGTSNDPFCGYSPLGYWACSSMACDG